MTTTSYQQREEGFLTYPAEGLRRWLFRSPVLVWRSGLAGLLSNYIVMMAHTGRKSGKTRYTPIEYHRDDTGRIYVLSAWGEKAQWYKNVMSNPLVTLQVGYRAHAMQARRAVDGEVMHAYNLFKRENPMMTAWYLQSIDIQDNADDIRAHRDRLHFVTFDPTTQPTPPPLKADLRWLWGIIAVVFVTFFMFGRRSHT